MPQALGYDLAISAWRFKMLVKNICHRKMPVSMHQRLRSVHVLSSQQDKQSLIINGHEILTVLILPATKCKGLPTIKTLKLRPWLNRSGDYLKLAQCGREPNQRWLLRIMQKRFELRKPLPAGICFFLKETMRKTRHAKCRFQNKSWNQQKCLSTKNRVEPTACKAT